MLRGLGCVAAATVLVLASGCVGSKKTTAPVSTDVVITTDYVVKANGAVDLASSGKIPVRVVAIRSSDPQFRGVTLLSVGPKEPVKGEGPPFRVAFDLTQYAGDGKYAIRAGSPRDLAEAAKAGTTSGPPDQSNVLVQVWRNGDVQSAPEVFDKALVPCPVESKDDGRRGVLRCPEVTNDSGKVMSVEMRWGKK